MSTSVCALVSLMTLVGVTFGYPYSRGIVTRSASDRFNSAPMKTYSRSPAYGMPEYRQLSVPEYRQPSVQEYRQLSVPEYRQPYGEQRQWDPETMAALVPYMTPEDYNVYESNTGNIDDGIWFDETVNENNQVSELEDSDLLQLLLDHLAGKYSLEDLERLETEAEMEDNTENQLRQLKVKKNSMTSSTRGQKKGQKEEAPQMPAASARKASLPQQQQPETSSIPSQITTQKNISEKDSKTSRPKIENAYDALKQYLDTERKQRQEKDEGGHPHKRFISEQDSLTQQLSNLKKNFS